jgi:hypothetical protein
LFVIHNLDTTERKYDVLQIQVAIHKIGQVLKVWEFLLLADYYQAAALALHLEWAQAECLHYLELRDYQVHLQDYQAHLQILMHYLQADLQDYQVHLQDYQAHQLILMHYHQVGHQDCHRADHQDYLRAGHQEHNRLLLKRELWNATLRKMDCELDTFIWNTENIGRVYVCN